MASRGAGKGRHRIAGCRGDSPRMVVNDAGAWWLAPPAPVLVRPASSSAAVGRLGALAVALGVGGFLVGFPAVAAADGRSGEGSVAETPRPAKSSGSTGASDEQRGRGRAARDSVAARGDSDTGTGAGSQAGSGSGGRVRDSVRPGNVSAPDSAVGSNDSPVVADTAAGGAGRGVGAANTAVTQTVPPAAALPSAATTPVVAATAPSVQDSPPAGQVTDAPAASSSAAAAPQVHAADPPVAVASAQLSATDPLTAAGGGGDPLAPAVTPLAWTVAAASRRELSGDTAAPVVAAAQTVPAAASGDPAMEMIAQSLAMGQTMIQSAMDILGAFMARPSSGNPVHDILSFVIESTGAALSVPANQEQLGAAVTGLINVVAGDAGIRTQLGTVLRQELPALLGDVALAGAIADAAEAILADPDLSGAIADIAGSAVTSLLRYLAVPNVIDAVETMTLQVADALMITGTDPFVPVQAALAALQADPVVVAGLNAAVAEITEQLNTKLLGNPLVTQAIGEIASALVGTTVAGSPDALGDLVTTAIGSLLADPTLATTIAAQVGPVLGPAVSNLLANTAAMGAIADALGVAVNTFVNSPGAADALEQLIPAFLTPAPGTDLLTAALQALQASPALLSALSTTVPAVVGALLGDPAVPAAFGTLAADLVTSALNSVGINIGFVDTVVGNIASTAVTSLLTKPELGRLVEKVALDFLYGAPVNDVITAAVQTVLRDPGLQGALGAAVGEIVGNGVFGDNIIGDAVSLVAGGVVSVTLGVASGVVLFFIGLGPVAGSFAGVTDESLAAAEAAGAAAAAAKAAASNALARAAAAMVAAAAAAWDPALPTPQKTLQTIATVIAQFAGWPEPANTPFTSPANYSIEQSIDAQLAKLDYYVANPTPGTQFLADWNQLFTAWITPAAPGYTKFSDNLKAVASALNRVIPPYEMQVGGIYRAQVAAGAMGALLRITNAFASGETDLNAIQTAATNGGIDGFIRPNSILDQSFSVLTVAEPNLFSFVTFLGLMVAFNRFKDVGTNRVPVVTSVTFDNQFAFSVTGKINAYDPDGDTITYEWTNPDRGTIAFGANGGFIYTRSTNQTYTDIDYFDVKVTDRLGVNGDVAGKSLDHPYEPNGFYTLYRVGVPYTGTANNAPTAAIVFTSGAAGTNNGVTRGYIDGNDIDGDTLTYTLKDPGTAGAAPNSIYTSKGAIVQIDTASGQWIYIPKNTSLTTDSFTVVVSDGRGGTSNQTVVPTTALGISTVKTSTSAYVERGRVNVAGINVGLFTYSLGNAPTKGTVVVNADGTYIYTRDSSRPDTESTSDTFTIIGTDAYGKSLTLATASVAPPLLTIVPTTNATGGTFTRRTMLNGTATVPGTQTTTGTFSGIDNADGLAVTVKGGSYTSARGGTVTVTAGGGFLYTRTGYMDMWHKAAADDATPEDKVDTVTINVTTADGVNTKMTAQIVLRTENYNPTSDSSVGSPDALGVVRGSVTGDDEENDPFTYSLVGASGSSKKTANGGIVTLNADGTFTYIPNKSGATSDTFQVLVNDGHGGTATETVTVPISIQTQPTNVNTSTPNTVTGKLNIPSADAGLMTYSLGTGPTKGTVTVNSDGTFTYVRTAGLGHTTTPDDAFTVIGTQVATGLTVTIANLNVFPTIPNNAPVANGVTVNGTVGAPPTYCPTCGPNHQQNTTGTLKAIDADGDAISWVPGTYDTVYGGEVTVNANGTFSYSISKFAPFGVPSGYWHDRAREGDPGDTFTITVKDGFGGSSNVIYGIPGARLNEAPTLSGSISSKSADALGVIRGSIAGGSDGDDDTLTYSLVGATGGSVYGSNGGIVSLSGTSFTYIPKVGVSTDTFQVQVSDGHWGTATATVTLTGITTPSPTTNINTSTPNVVTGALNVPAGDTGFTYGLGSTAPSKGTVTVNANGTFTYTRTAAPSHTGLTDTFTIKATDASGKSVTIATISVTPTITNTAPALTLTTAPTTGTLNGTTQTSTGKITATDAEGDTLTYPSTVTSSKGGTVTFASNGSFTYVANLSTAVRHAAAKIGAPSTDVNDSFTVTVTDGYGGSTNLTVNVPIYALNSVPGSTVSVSGQTTSTLGVVRGTVAGTDADSDTLTYSLVGASGGSVYGSNGGIITLSGGSFTYIPKVGVSTDTFQVQVSDGYGGTSTATVTLTGLTTPSPTNISTATSDVVTGALNVPLSDTGLGLTYSLGSTAPSKGTVTVNADGTFTYTRTAPRTDPQLTDSFTIKATDASGKSVTIATISVTPTAPGNTAPVLSLTTAPTTGTLNGTTQTSTGKITATDAEGDTLTYPSTVTSTKGGTVTFAADGSFTYVANLSTAVRHAAAKIGAPSTDVNDSFTVAVTDALGASTNLTVNVPIYALNAVPGSTVSVSGQTTSTLGVVRGTVAGTDADSDTLTYSLVGATSGSVYGSNGGIITLSGGSFTYIPKVGVTSDTFQVQVSDGYGGTSTATVTLTGLTTPSPTTNINTSTPNVVTGALNVPAGDTGLGLTYSLGSTAPSKGTVTVNADGTFTYTRTAAPSHTGLADSFTIKATDASGKSVTIATITVTPTITNTAPVAKVNNTSGTLTLSSPGTLSSNTQTVTGLTWTATDAELDSLSVNNKFDGTGTTFLLSSGGTIATANGGTVTVNSDGTMSYSITKDAAYRLAAAKIGASGTAVADWFNFTVTDGYGGTSTVRVNVPVYAVNTPPNLSKPSGATCGAGTCTVTVTLSDPDGTTVTGRAGSNQGNGTPWQTLSNGSITVNSGNQATFSWTGNSDNLGTRVTATTAYTFYDGYYKTTNGVVDTNTPSFVRVTYSKTDATTRAGVITYS